MSLHYPIFRLPSFFSLSEGVCVGLGVESRPCTGTPTWDQELRNYHSLPLPLSTAPFLLVLKPNPLIKRGAKETEIIL